MTTKTFYSEPVCLLKEEGQGIGECVSEDFYSDIDISTMYSTNLVIAALCLVQYHYQCIMSKIW